MDTIAALSPDLTVASAAGMTAVVRSGNPNIDGILDTKEWTGTTVTYGFPDASGDYPFPYGHGEPSSGFQQVSLSEMQAIRHILEGTQGVETFTNLNMSETPVGAGGADIMIGQFALPANSSPAYTYTLQNNSPIAGDVWFGNNSVYNFRNPILGTYEYATHLHEIGHALGLTHGHETDGFGALPSDRDDLEFSVMTYRSYLGGPTDYWRPGTFDGPQTYMMDDVLALQYLYGADYTYNSSSTTYTWSTITGEMFVNGVGQGAPGGGIGGAANRVFDTIWDGGGSDTYDMSNYTGSETIDLRAGQWSITDTNQRANLGDGHFAQGTVYNSYLFGNNTASLIENAFGGSGADYIFGNEAANYLVGNAGNDTISGTTGNDTIFGGSGTDMANFGGPRSNYTITRGSDGSIKITDNKGGEGTDTIFEVEQFKFTDRATPYSLDEILPSGGRWIISAAGQPVVLGINNGVAPIFPTPQIGAFNIEVFTNTTVMGSTGLQSSIVDLGGTLNSGFLTGTDLRLGAGDFLVLDSVTGASNQSPSQITLGTGNQTVVGAKSDTLIGGSGNQILSALLGNETVVGGTGNASVWGGASDSIVAGSGAGANEQIVVTGAATTVVAGMSGNAVISLVSGDTVTALPGGTQNVVIAAGTNNLIDLTGNKAASASAVIGKTGDTITGGSGTTAIEGSAGGMLIKVGAAGTTSLSGNTGAAHNTVNGGVGSFNFNPGAVAGSGDLIDLSGSTGTAQINAFSFQTTRVAAADTILATNNADSVFGGAGDRIGTGKGSTVSGLHQWSHADTVAGSAVGFGTNDTVSSTTYNTVTHIATRGTAPGTSSAQVTVGGFKTTSDFLFYQNESAATTNAIIATSQATSVNGTASTIMTLPDGTVMTLVGITPSQLTPALFKL